MKQTLKQTLLVKLAPTPDQHAALLRTLETFNAACNDIADTAFVARCANRIALQKLVYDDIREQVGLSSQMTIRAISKGSEAYKRDRSKQLRFRPHGAMVYDEVYDERICSFPRIDRVSLLTLDGRVEIPFRFGAYAEGLLARKRGQADLLYRASTDTFFLAITVDAPEPRPADTEEFLDEFLLVDLGIIQWATTSAGEFLNSWAAPKHSHVKQVRARYSRFRQQLQKKGTKSAKRRLKQRSGQEKRFAKAVNHCLSKAMVQPAKGTGRGIAREDLKNIRSRGNGSTSKRPRRVLHTWSFFQLRAFIAYKAALAGVRVV